MIKTLVRFFGGAVMVWGVGLLGLTATAAAQGSVTFYVSADTGSGSTHQTYPQVIHVYNAGPSDATGVTVTFTPPKGVKVAGSCLVDHLSGGLRTYTCSLGTITSLQTVDVVFTVSMTKPGDASFTADVTCNEGATAIIWLPITIS
jgi:hypothetical protein